MDHPSAGFSPSPPEESDRWCRLASALLAQTQQLLALATANEWETLEAAQQQRQRIIDELFAEAIPLNSSEFVGRCLGQVLQLDAKLRAILVQGQKQSTHHLGELRRGRSACQAYIQWDTKSLK